VNEKEMFNLGETGKSLNHVSINGMMERRRKNVMKNNEKKYVCVCVFIC
jgi:hypothetical protein